VKKLVNLTLNKRKVRKAGEPWDKEWLQFRWNHCFHVDDMLHCYVTTCSVKYPVSVVVAFHKRNYVTSNNLWRRSMLGYEAKCFNRTFLAMVFCAVGVRGMAVCSKVNERKKMCWCETCFGLLI